MISWKITIKIGRGRLYKRLKQMPMKLKYSENTGKDILDDQND